MLKLHNESENSVTYSEMHIQHRHTIRTLQREREVVNWEHLCFSLTPIGASWKTVFCLSGFLKIGKGILILQ